MESAGLQPALSFSRVFIAAPHGDVARPVAADLAAQHRERPRVVGGRAYYDDFSPLRARWRLRKETPMVSPLTQASLQWR
jgi:hypothetical protein